MPQDVKAGPHTRCSHCGEWRVKHRRRYFPKAHISVWYCRALPGQKFEPMGPSWIAGPSSMDKVDASMTLKEWRERENLTLRQAGDLIGIHHTRLADYEGGANMSFRAADQIARKTGGKVTRADWPEQQWKRKT